MAAANEANDCLKAMRALARDPMIPAQDEIIILSAHTSISKKATEAIVQGLLFGGIVGVANASSGSSAGTEDVTYSCFITREALMNGEEPKPLQQNEKKGKP